MATWQYIRRDNGKEYVFNIPLDRSRGTRFRSCLKNLDSFMLGVEGNKMIFLGSTILNTMKKTNEDSNELGEWLYNAVLFCGRNEYRPFKNLKEVMEKIGLAMNNPLKKVILDADNEKQTYRYSWGTDIVFVLEKHYSSYYLACDERTYYSDSISSISKMVFDKIGIEESKIHYYPHIDDLRMPDVDETKTKHGIEMGIYMAEEAIKYCNKMGYNNEYPMKVLAQWHLIQDTIKNNKITHLNTEMNNFLIKKGEIVSFFEEKGVKIEDFKEKVIEFAEICKNIDKIEKDIIKEVQ